jgi:CRISPR-associated protein Csx17
VTVVKERLPGCNAESLDSYLRGLGFFLIAGEVESSVRAWWDEDGVLWMSSPCGLTTLVPQVVRLVQRGPRPVTTPWRGGAGRGKSFIALRNTADEEEIDWFDACALPRAGDDMRTQRSSAVSDRENNPLLGQGGAFGKAKPEDAYKKAHDIVKSVKPDSLVVDSLLRLLRGEAIDAKLARKLSVSRVVLGAYQSGRATGPGLSAKDVEPTNQSARASAWDVLLVLNGLRLFQGTAVRRADPRARAQASFPFIVRGRPLATGPSDVHELRSDDPQTFEFLAPLWGTPCSIRTARHLISSCRLRLRSGYARDTLDASLVQASSSAHGVGFDRLVRFALVADSDPRYRYAVRRGVVYALANTAARAALREIVPFLRELERQVREEPPALRIARRRLEDALARLGRKGGPSGSLSARDVQDVLIAQAVLQTPAAHAAPGLRAPRLSADWFRFSDDGSSEFHLARSLVAGLSDQRKCLLCETVLPHSPDNQGDLVLDATRTPPDLEHVSDPLAALVELVLAALRRVQKSYPLRVGSTSFSHLTSLLSGAGSRDRERRLALLSAAFAGVHPASAPAAEVEDPAMAGIGADVARLLLAAQPATGESPSDSLERTTALASLLLAGRIDLAWTMADRELRRRGIDLLPALPRFAPAPRPAALAFAVLLPFDAHARSALERAVSIH